MKGVTKGEVCVCILYLTDADSELARSVCPYMAVMSALIITTPANAAILDSTHCLPVLSYWHCSFYRYTEVHT